MPTGLLEKALAEIAKLPDEEQEAIGAWLLEELAAERTWAELLARSQDALAQLADEALREHNASDHLYPQRSDAHTSVERGHNVLRNQETHYTTHSYNSTIP